MFASSTHDANIASGSVDGAQAPPDQGAPPPKPLVRGKIRGAADLTRQELSGGGRRYGAGGSGNRTRAGRAGAPTPEARVTHVFRYRRSAITGVDSPAVRRP